MTTPTPEEYPDPQDPQGRRPLPPASSTTVYRASRRGRRGGNGRRSRPRRLSVLLLAFVLVVVAYAVGVVIWAVSQIQRTDALGDYDGRPAAGAGTNWLLVGSDSRTDLTKEQQQELHTGSDSGNETDTIIVLHYGKSGPYLVSLPRDSYVNIPGHGMNKINASFAIGGAPLLTRTVEEATGLRLDHYAEVSFLGFVDVVNALGGVEVCVPQDLDDSYSGADFKAGCQTMNGNQALAYARDRHSYADGDLGRVQAQQRLIAAIADKALSPATLLNPFKLLPFLDASLNALTVDQDAGITNLGKLGLEMDDISHGDGSTTTVPIGSEPYVAGVGDVVEWNRAEAEELFSALRDDTTIPTFDSN
ncbi:LytR family transcriptional regulator [Streptomyces sp. SID8379]|uniref:LCP family protein n=1 Tax=unclassified Streptomyces TaxID=2593676 RepID=UPI000379B554|nr:MULTISPECIES: LCP family protein [unclassified Streptomyces]MYW69180.1 LytR family transcriptional regulator [Streptomyces sp. SID8379]